MPKVLSSLARPPLAPMPDPWFEGMFGGGYEKSKQLSALHKALADFIKDLAAGDHVTTDDIHFSADANVKLGSAIADKVATLF